MAMVMAGFFGKHVLDTLKVLFSIWCWVGWFNKNTFQPRRTLIVQCMNCCRTQGLPAAVVAFVASIGPASVFLRHVGWCIDRLGLCHVRWCHDGTEVAQCRGAALQSMPHHWRSYPRGGSEGPISRDLSDEKLFGEWQEFFLKIPNKPSRL